MWSTVLHHPVEFFPSSASPGTFGSDTGLLSGLSATTLVVFFGPLGCAATPSSVGLGLADRQPSRTMMGPHPIGAARSATFLFGKTGGRVSCGPLGQ